MADTTIKDPKVEHVVKEFQRYESFHADRWDLMDEIREQWRNKPPKRDYSWQNQVHVPLIVEGEQTISPRLFTALFPTDAPVDVHVEGDAPEEQGIRIKGIIQHYFRVADVQAETIPMLTQLTLLGTGYMDGGSWFVRKGWQIKPNGDRYFVPIEARPDCKFVDFFEMFPHPAKLKINDGLPLIRRRFIDAEQLKRMAKHDENFGQEDLDRALESKPVGVSDKSEEYGEDDFYEILEYWGPWDDEIHGDDKDPEKVISREAVPYWIIVVNRTVAVRCIPNPYNHQLPPYCKSKLFEDPEPSWFGVGMGQIGKPTQDRVNKIVNQRLDNVDLVLNKQGFYNGNDTLINTKKLQISQPGMWRKVSDTVNSIRWMETPDVTKSSYEEEKIAKQDFRESTGATVNLMPGEKEDQHRTALGIQLLQGAAGMRFRPVLRKLEMDYIQQLAMFFFSNLKQFMTEAQWVLVTGEQGVQKPIRITPEQIQAKVFFIPTGISETMNKETQVGQLLRFKEVTAQDPTINRTEINKRIAELFGFKDIQKLMTPMQQPPQGGLTGYDQQSIQQRIAEGANPDQIKAEMLGPRPNGVPVEPPQGPEGQGGPGGPGQGGPDGG